MTFLFHRVARATAEIFSVTSTRTDVAQLMAGRAALFCAVLGTAFAGTAPAALAQTAAESTTSISLPDTAWITTATALVLMMTIPGLALFYSGMVRKKNVLATMAQSLSAVAFVSILWAVIGYSLAFTGDGPWLGTWERALLQGIGADSVNPLAKTIPETLFMLFQMTFAVITVALVAGSVADRMRFKAFVLFSILWLLVVYVPLAHWIWGGGFLASAGVMDFAGGLVVHLSAGTGGLVAALVLGPRRGFGTENMSPYDLSLAVIGTGLLWVGWFGFNGGSALGIGVRAIDAITATHLAACAGAATWALIEWLQRGKPSVLGMISGAIAGLGTITPASGFIAPGWGIVIGIIAGIVCYWACISLKPWLRYDDSLDVFGVHGIGGLTGTLLAGVFASSAIGGTAGLIEGNPGQLLTQLYGIAVTFVWTGIATFVLLKLVALITPLRVSAEQEMEGLDITQHGESLQ